MGIPYSLSERFASPAWHSYNLGLVKLTDPKLSKGPVMAKGCGHFIQKDDPEVVAKETLELVDKVSA